ncbi:hypothetical protein O3P69_014322 [Scylla paramamosain]|uniref:Caspase family p10 domain-containing protein n=1 Tax=Scylla paramamosain TaxID=85552 RepID=A0AAW0TDA5_SCYPA
MGYDVELYEDLKKEDNMRRIKEFSTSERLKKFCRGKIRPIIEENGMDHVSDDIISFYSTSDGFVVYEEPQSGSVFLSVVCEAERACEDSLDDLFRQVQRRYRLEWLGTTPEKQDLGFSKKLNFNSRLRKYSGLMIDGLTSHRRPVMELISETNGRHAGDVTGEPVTG